VRNRKGRAAVPEVRRAAGAGIALFLASSAFGGCSASSGDDHAAPATPFAQVVDSIAAAFRGPVGSALHRPLDAYFVNGGRDLLILDRTAPHLRLLEINGSPLWSGGGPEHGLDRPWALAVRADTALVFQRGRISSWRISREGLVPMEQWTMSPHYMPLGAVSRCGDGWYMYAASDEQLVLPDGASGRHRSVDFLFSLDLSADEARLTPVWSERLDLPLSGVHGHSGSLISRTDSTIVVLHRPGAVQAGDILELDCAGRELRSVPEWVFIAGDGIDVKEPRPRALEWTSGIVALPYAGAVEDHRL